jgi:glycosyl transferase family 10 (putative fucosyltransferase)
MEAMGVASLKVNLFDHAFSHVPYSVPGRTSRYIQWVRGRMVWDGVTVITDNHLRYYKTLFPDRLQLRPLIGWLLEGRGYAPGNYEAIPSVIDRLDLLMTHDQGLLDRYPEKARFVPFGGCWIADKEWPELPKDVKWDVSHIYSGKKFMQGHQLRHEIARDFPGIHHYGHGSKKPLANKADGLLGYGFSIVVENDRAYNYFTEKLIDCFACGTIPIYWGCPNIGKFFDLQGIIQFDKITDLPDILAQLDYSQHAAAAIKNQNLARQYVLPEDYMYEHVLKAYDK